jgi:hypothetical protein
MSAWQQISHTMQEAQHCLADTVHLLSEKFQFIPELHTKFYAYIHTWG